MPEMLVSKYKYLIQWGDCDPANIVYYPNYFRMFDVSTANHFVVAGLPKTELIRRFGVVGFPMVDTGAKFFIPSTHGDEIEIETQITAFGRSSFEVKHRVLRGEKVAIEGHEKRVLVKKGDGKNEIQSCPIPEEVKQLFQT